MNAQVLRSKFIEFFNGKNHKEIPPASLIPPDDPTTLFTSSGMQQLVPYLKGETHPMGKRLVDSQPCFRAEDIDEIGDNRHTTFFEMLGNWSLGDYFKQDQLTWFWEFLTEVLKLPKARLHVTIFDGDKNLKRKTNVSQSLTPDVESKSMWLKLGVPESHIHWYRSDKNWWSRAGTPEKMPVNEIGGPDSEVFYDFGAQLKIHENSPFKNQHCHINCDCGRFLEIGNSVFMQYKKKTDGILEPLPNKNVDFGGGLERILAALENKPDLFKTELFWPIIEEIENLTGKSYQDNEKPMRVISDHLRAATFMIAQGLEPSNKLQGYVLRRLLRRAAVKMHDLTGGLKLDFSPICLAVIQMYQGKYFKNKIEIHQKVSNIINQEMDKFAVCLTKGLKEFEKAADKQLNELFAFNLLQTYGFPFEITAELFQKKGKKIDRQKFDRIYEKHQDLSRKVSTGIFKGGLADHSETITKLHTATHLLHSALRQVLGKHVQQVGSNITSERLRFDFTHPQKLAQEEIKQAEDLINQQIKKNLKIECKIMSLEEAKKLGALAFFGQKYPQKVKVYQIQAFSLEVCGGPHSGFTGSLGMFRIKKEESNGAGKRRIYGVLENACQK